MSFVRNLADKVFGILLLVFFSYCFPSMAGENHPLEIIVSRDEVLRKGYTQLELRLINKTGKNLFLENFRSQRGLALFIVDITGDYFPDQTYHAPRPGPIEYISGRRIALLPDSSNQYSTISMKKGRGFDLADKDNIYFLVVMIRKPFDKSGVIFSTPTRFELNSNHEIVSYSMIPVSDLPGKAKLTFLREILTRLKLEEMPVLKADIPFY